VEVNEKKLLEAVMYKRWYKKQRRDNYQPLLMFWKNNEKGLMLPHTYGIHSCLPARKLAPTVVYFYIENLKRHNVGSKIGSNVHKYC
jgi:hypothetical protein